MNNIVVAGFLILSINCFGQKNEPEIKENVLDFDRWSFEISAGTAIPSNPFTNKYFTLDPKKTYGDFIINHRAVGARYMFSHLFGVKLEASYDHFTNQPKSTSLKFETEQYGISFQGVANIGSLLDFRSFTKRINLLGHAGFKLSQFTPVTGPYKTITEDNGGLVIGFTPQFRVTNNFVVTADITILNNLRQHYNWDGVTLATSSDNLSGTVYTASFGLTYYIGRYTKHADWFDKIHITKNLIDIAIKEAKLNDTVKDSIADVSTVEKKADKNDEIENIGTGIVLDNKGKIDEVTKNLIPDEVEAKDISELSNNSNDFIQLDPIKMLVDSGYLNIFYNINADFPNQGSTSIVYQLIEYMKKNTSVKIKLKGNADLVGGDLPNRELSFRRTSNLKRILAENGVNESRITIEALGIDKSFSGMKANLDFARRVTIKVDK